MTASCGMRPTRGCGMFKTMPLFSRSCKRSPPRGPVSEFVEVPVKAEPKSSFGVIDQLGRAQCTSAKIGRRVPIWVH
jgi:hypothetical protein